MNIVVVKKDFLATIKNEKRFIDSVQLGRILGALRYNKIIQAKIRQILSVFQQNIFFYIKGQKTV